MKRIRKNLVGLREPVYAGSFYPESEKLLLEQLDELFLNAVIPVAQSLPRALIAPHAGYIFSGGVAASAYNQLSYVSNYKRVFVLASSHHYSFRGASPGTSAFYRTPLGEIKVDNEVTNKLLKSGRLFCKYPEVHNNEHSIEVQLPFIQYKLDENIMLVPVLFGACEMEDCELIAHQLNPWFTPENLFVVSTDFSHYPAYNDAVDNDYNTAMSICSNNPYILKQNLETDLEIANLATSLCGWPAVIALLFLTQQKEIQYRLIEYMNSGDAENYADEERVVGYWAMAVFEKPIAFSVSEEVQEKLLHIARESVIRFVSTGGQVQESDSAVIEGQSSGMFVSIYIGDELRGCIGNHGESQDLGNEVEHLALSALCDERFKDISEAELDDLVLEISILTPLKRINSIDEIIPGKHGVYIKKASKSGTYLPKIAPMFGWNAEELLSNCALEKAGIGQDGWKDAELYVFEAIVFRR